MFFAAALGLAGLFLIFLEFFLPGIVMAVGGAVLLLASLFLVYMKAGAGPTLFYLLVLAVSLYAVMRMALWFVKRTGKKGTVYLASDQEGFQASLYPKEFIGMTGVAASDLKPSGHIWIGDHAVQALSKDGYIDKGTPIQVLGGQGSHLIVKTLSEISS